MWYFVSSEAGHLPTFVLADDTIGHFRVPKYFPFKKEAKSNTFLVKINVIS